MITKVFGQHAVTVAVREYPLCSVLTGLLAGISFYFRVFGADVALDIRSSLRSTSCLQRNHTNVAKLRYLRMKATQRWVKQQSKVIWCISVS